MKNLKAPFPYFGGKSMIAADVWQAIGQPGHYIEPFFGSGAVLLARDYPDPLSRRYTETVNDADGYICNVWRALHFAPDETAKWCDWPVNHADLIARKARLIREENYLLENLCKDDKWFDAELAGYWIWAASCWIGSGLTNPGGRPHLVDKGNGVHALNLNIYDWFRRLAERLRYVRVVCGDWKRVCGGDWQDKAWPTVGIFFDPPYSAEAGRDNNLYQVESLTVAHDVRAWCLERGERKKYRIVLAGYYEEHEELLQHGWTVKRWKTQGGYGRLGGKDAGTRGQVNRHREALFISPHCAGVKQSDFFLDKPAETV